MVIYRLSPHHAVANALLRPATYRVGVEIKDERSGKLHNYTKRSGVMGAHLFTHDSIKMNRSNLRNLAETTETRKNSRIAREIVINLPHELSNKQKGKAVGELAKYLVNKYGEGIDACSQAPDK